MSQPEEQKLLHQWRFYKGVIMDTCEQELSSSPKWEFVRSRLLKYLGENGMEGAITKFIKSKADEKRRENE